MHFRGVARDQQRRLNFEVVPPRAADPQTFVSSVTVIQLPAVLAEASGGEGVQGDLDEPTIILGCETDE
jgi:hypothetical protein